LHNYDEVFRQRLMISFDGIAVTPEIDYSVSGTATETTAPVATIWLRGAVPPGARQFGWTYSWTFATYSLTVREAGGDTETTEWLEGGQASTPISLVLPQQPLRRTAIAFRYLALGFTHIVPHGLDHMLFVLGIFLLSRRLRQVLAQVSAFTVAHSITLALSIYGIVSVSPRVVEPLIAVSIAYVAIENIFMSELKPWRVALVFAFGLLHGMGFAGALKELGLPRSEFLTALVTFNIGVESGQLAVIGAAFLLVGWYGGGRPWYRRIVVVPASMLIACTAVYWTVQRLFLLSL
jgi:hydrogenase/urease accessory protein HupE